MCSTARGTCLSSAEPRCPEESHSSFYSLFFPAEFLSATTNLFLSTATGLDKDVYPMQKHLPRSGMDFLYIFYLSCSLHFFPSIWSRQHQQVCHTSSLLLRLSFYPFHPFLCNIFPFKLNSLTQTFLSSFTLRIQWVPGHSFLPGNDAADELARQRALFLTSAISFFSDWRRTASSKLKTQFPSIPRETCAASSCLAMYYLVCAATDTAFY